MISKEGIIEYFSARATGVHRHDTEDFLQLEAREKIFHMGPAGRVLDFGCGTGDLLAYYARQYQSVVGIDIAVASVERARKRLETFGAINATVLQGDESTAWKELEAEPFDVITSAAVMQYLSESQFRAFLRRARSHISPIGLVAMFDVIDPRLYWLFKYGWFRNQRFGASYVLSSSLQSIKVLLRKIVRTLAGRPEDHMGRAHSPLAIRKIAEEEGFVSEFVGSMYYEYRYHALLKLAA